MKPFILIFSSSLSLFACETKGDAVRAFIPGIYVQYSENDMGRRQDTLHVERMSTSGHNYRITRTSSMQRWLDGKAFPWQYRKEIWTGIYDEDKRVLNETKRGRLLSFVPERNILLMGTTAYKKIK